MSLPGIRVRPKTPMANVQIRTSSGARMRRRTRKIAVEDGAESRATAAAVAAAEGRCPGQSCQFRRNDAVSITNRMTDTMLANRAPPDNDTTLAI